MDIKEKNKIIRRNRSYVIMLVVLLILFLFAIFGTDTGRNANINEKIGIIFAILFAFSAYLRMYYIYKLEKYQGIHRHNSFIDFFNFSFSNKRLGLIFSLFPYVKKYNIKKLDIIRKQINYATYSTYIFLLFFVYLIVELK